MALRITLLKIKQKVSNNKILAHPTPLFLLPQSYSLTPQLDHTLAQRVDIAIKLRDAHGARHVHHRLREVTVHAHHVRHLGPQLRGLALELVGARLDAAQPRLDVPVDPPAAEARRVLASLRAELHGGGGEGGELHVRRAAVDALRVGPLAGEGVGEGLAGDLEALVALVELFEDVCCCDAVQGAWGVGVGEGGTDFLLRGRGKPGQRRSMAPEVLDKGGDDRDLLR